MAMSAVKLSLALGALGAKKLGENEEVVEILKFGLSFVCPESVLDVAFSLIGAESEVTAKLAEVGFI